MELKEIELPKWEQLPDIELYMDQVLMYTQKYLRPMDVKDVTASMINNYVKLKLIPAPIKKKYNRVHVAYIFAIAILKDVFEISMVKQGVDIQVKLLGAKDAYNLFVSSCQWAIVNVQLQMTQSEARPLIEEPFSPDKTIMKMAATAFASQWMTHQIIQTYIEGEKHAKNSDSNGFGK